MSLAKVTVTVAMLSQTSPSLQVNPQKRCERTAIFSSPPLNFFSTEIY